MKTKNQELFSDFIIVLQCPDSKPKADKFIYFYSN